MLCGNFLNTNIQIQKITILTYQCPSPIALLHVEQEVTNAQTLLQSNIDTNQLC